VQEAVFRVQTRIAKPIPDAKEHTMLARFLVSSNQIGCLLGKGGSIITEMRKKSGAHIRILGKDKVPKCASEDEEVIQVQIISCNYLKIKSNSSSLDSQFYKRIEFLRFIWEN